MTRNNASKADANFVILGKRFSIFYTSGCIAPALGGIMAGAILSHMDGVRGWEGWR